MVWKPYLRDICDALQNPKLDLVVVNVPPSFGKSEICSVMFPAWCWARDASIRIISVSHTEKLVVNFMQHSRDLIESKEYRTLFPHVQFHESHNTKSEQRTNKLGERLAVSPGGKPTGRHGNLLILDDPIDASAALKPKEIQNFNDWFNNVLQSRRLGTKTAICETGAKTIIVQQRIAFNDISGDLISRYNRKKSFQHLKFPIVDESGNSLNDILWPLSRIQSEIFDVHANNQELLKTQYYQDPTPNTKESFSADWFELDFTKLEDLIPDEIFIGVDCASVVSKRADYTAFVVMLRAGNKLYCVDALNEKIPFSEQKKQLRLMAEKWSNRYPMTEVQVLIESKSNGVALLDVAETELEGLNVAVQGVTPVKSKEIRLQQTQWLFKDGSIHFMQDSMPLGLYQELAQQVIHFGNHPHDDLMDAMVMILLWNIDQRRFVGKTDADRLLQAIKYGRRVY